MSEIRQLVVSLTMETDSAQQNLRGLRSAVQQANAAFDEATAGVKDFANTTVGMKAKVDQLTRTLDAQKQMAAEYRKELEKAQQRVAETAGKQAELAAAVKKADEAYKASVRAKGKDAEETQKLKEELDKARASVVANEKAMSRAANSVNKNETQLTRANAAIKNTEKALKDATAQLDRFGGRFKDVMRAASAAAGQASVKLNQWGRAITTRVTLPIVGLAGAAAKAAVDWDTAWVGVQKTVDGTAEEMAALEKQLMGLGGELPETLSGIAGVAEAAGQLGIERANIIGFTRTMVNLGNATNLTADAAATAAAQFANIYKMNQGDFDRWGSTVVALGNNFATTEKDIVDMSMGLAAAGKQAKLSESDTLALATALSSLGLEAAGGGSAMSKVMMDMGIAVDKGGRQLNNFAKVSGMSAKEFKAQWERDPARAIDAFIQGLGRIEESGGNVALTLQNMGYNERRLLDTLQRLTGAGDIFTRALDLSNGAWARNNALTNEASKRNNSLAGVLQRTKNRITVASVEIGQKLTPYIEKAAEWVTNLVEGFRNLDPAVQANILKWVGIAAAVGPVILVLGKLAAALKVITAVLAGPAGWVAWAAMGVAAVAGIGFALANVQTAAEKAEKSLSNIKMSVSADSQEKITSGINAGIAAANKAHEISVEVNADATSIGNQLDKIFEDGRMTNREFVAVRKFVRERIQPDIDMAKSILDQRVAAFRRSLDGATDSEGNLLSETEKEELVTQFKAEQSASIQELEAAMAEFDKLLVAVRNSGKGVTAQQIADLETAIAKVTELRKLMLEAYNDTIAAAKADYNLTISGAGNEKSTAGAIGYVSQTHANDLAVAEDMLEKAKAAATTNEEVSAAYAAYDAAVATANQNAQGMYEKIAAGVSAGNDNIQHQLDIITHLKAGADELNNILSETDPIKMGQAIIDAVSEGGVLRQYLTMDQSWLIDQLIGDGTVTAADLAQITGVVENLRVQIAEETEAAITALDETPMDALIKAMLDAKAFDAIDPTTVSGPLLDFLKTVDVKSGGELLAAGIQLGVNEGAETYLTSEQLSPMKDAVTNAIKALFDIRSPSHLVEPLGQQIPAGLAQGILNNKGAMVSAIQQMYAAAMAEVNRLDPILRAAMSRWMGGGGGGRGGSTTTLNANTNLNVQTMNLNNGLDARVLSIQMEAERKRRLAAFGT